MIHGNRALSLVLHLKYWKFTIENMQLICQNFGCVP
jgi:hypothetical protein